MRKLIILQEIIIRVTIKLNPFINKEIKLELKLGIRLKLKIWDWEIKNENDRCCAKYDHQ